MTVSPSVLPIPWQRPNATEAYAAERMVGVEGYLSYPWASWIDAHQCGRLTAHLPLPRPLPPRAVTVCQHIRALAYAHLFRDAGVTDLFWPHATAAIQRVEGLRIHPFPLFPVRCSTHPPPAPPLPPEQRPWLYSFHGSYQPQLYLTPVRQWLFELPQRPDALLQQRSEWHFHQQVYREQVFGQPPDTLRHDELNAAADAYAAALQQSIFALCPSGSGPNSIRLWEALGYGAIPVLLADGLRLPGDPLLWQQALVRLPETREAVASIPSHLEALAAQPQRLAEMQAAGQQLWRRYGLPGFVPDLQSFLGDPHPQLLAGARARLEAQGCDPAAVLLLEAPQSSGLPLQLRRALREAPRRQPLLLHITDPGPLSLLQLRWRLALESSRALLADRPLAIASRSPCLEQWPMMG